MIRHKIYQILIIIFALTLSACEETFVEAFGVENPSGEVVPPQDEPVIIVLGEVITNVATDITESSVKLSGEIVSKGNSDSVEVGFLLYTGSESDFTTATNGVTSYVASVSGNSFSKSITSLTSSTKYKFRAYIKNEAGISYGQVKNFTTETGITQGEVITNAATEVTTSQARLNGDLVSTGNSTNYTIGFILYQGSSNNFTLTTSGVQNFEVPNSKSLFTKLLNNLNASTTYKFRAYITNEEGTSYGEVKTFTTEVAVTQGQVTTNNATDITTTTATLNGVLNSTGNSTNYTVGFLLYTGSVSNFTLTTSGVNNLTTTASGTSLSKVLANLTDNTTYKFRAYITNEAGTSYGDVKTFTTQTAVTLGQVTTNDATNITTTTATLKGVLNSTGNSTNYTVGFLLYQGSVSNFTLTTSGVQNYTTTASGTSLSKVLANLTDNTTYKFRTYITNEAGTNYGSIKTFTTEEEIPELSFVCLQTLTGHTYSVNTASYSPDGTKIVSGSYDNFLKIWDANTGQCLRTLTRHYGTVYSASYSPDGTKIVSASSDRKIKIWDANTGTCLQTLEVHTAGVSSALYSPDGTKIVSASYDTIKICDANTGTCLQTLTGHNGTVYSASYSPDGTKIVSASDDETIKIWDANTGSCLQTLTGHNGSVNSASYSPDGTKIVSSPSSSYDHTIKIWDANTGTCLQTLTGHTHYVYSPSYSPDGTKIVSASYDHTIKIWDANTGTCLQTLTGHTAGVRSASFSPDGTKIVSASDDRTIKIWGEN